MDKDEEMMPDFSFDFDVVSSFTPFGAHQMFTEYERNLQDLCFCIFYVYINLTSFNWFRYKPTINCRLLV